ncbi:hypothetical protein JJE64_09195 [Alloprevotella tannerae]|uniref:hypothetical protein n=1 Tax=Alloprevotella tannerae TaxID=76122 RepID=UPI001EDB342A|nr:hypothetical protein [Alloprevotella tannerae]MCG2651565.1 hypothetical protein [Alloprevotella tannerae]
MSELKLNNQPDHSPYPPSDAGHRFVCCRQTIVCSHQTIVCSHQTIVCCHQTKTKGAKAAAYGVESNRYALLHHRRTHLSLTLSSRKYLLVY